MKKKLFGLVAALACAVGLVFAIAPAFAGTETTYYVSATGNDSNAGTQEAPFATVTKAAASTSQGDTVVLLTDITENASIAAGKTLTLDLSGHNITATSTESTVITNAGTLTIKDSTATGSYVPDASGDVSYTAGKIKGGKYGIDNKGNLTLEGGIITDNHSTSSNAVRGAGITVSASSAVVTMTGGLITENTTSGMGAGIGIYDSNNVAINVSGGAITKNIASSSGGGIHIKNGEAGNLNKLTVSGDAYISFNTGFIGGGIHAYGNYSEINVSGGTISYNTTPTGGNYGGGIRGESGATINISDGLITQNKSTDYPAGGVYCDGKLNITGGTIKNNNYNNAYTGSEVYMNFNSSAAVHEFSMSGGIIENENLSATEKVAYIKGGKDASNHLKLSISGTADIRGAVKIGYAEFLDTTSSISGGKFQGALTFASSAEGATIPKIVSGGIYTDTAAGYHESEKTFDLTPYVVMGKFVTPNDDEATKTAYPWMIDTLKVAQIGTTKYDTLDDAIDAAKGGTADKPVVIEILVNEVSFTKAPSNYTTIVGLTDADGNPATKITGTPGSAGSLYSAAVDYNNASSVGITFKNLVFHNFGKVTVSGKDTTVDNCLFYRDSPSGTDNKNQLIRAYGETMTFNKCVFKNEYNAFWNSDIFNDGVCTFTDCKFENLGCYNLQFMSDGSRGSFIITDCEFEGKLTIARSYTYVLIKDCAFLPSTSVNEVGLYPSNCVLKDCTFDPAYATSHGVRAKEAASFVDVSGCVVGNNGNLFDIFTATAGKVAIDAQYDTDGKLAAGLIITTVAPTSLAKDCASAQIGDSLYIVGYGDKVAATSNKLTGGLYYNNPVSYVADGYKVVPSGNASYPFEVVKKETPQEDVHEKVLVNEVAVDVSETIKDEDLVPVATAVAQAEIENIDKAVEEDEIIKASKTVEGSTINDQKIGEANLIVTTVTVNVEAVATATPTESKGYLEFTCTPTAVVTTYKDGEVTGIAVDVPVSNDYLNGEKIVVTLGCAGIVPEQVVHISAGYPTEVYALGSKASYENRTFSYDEQLGVVTLEITHFSTIEILGSAKYAAVIFEANAKDAKGSMVSQGMELGVETSLIANEFMREGYTFEGWNTKADGTGTAYADKASITISEDVTLYAQWKEVVAPTPTPEPTPTPVPGTGDSAPLGGIALFALLGVAGLAIARKRLV